MKLIKVIYIKKLILPALCILFILGLVMFSETALDAAIRGINLWLTIVFPSLFPFFVASDLLQRSKFMKAAGILFEPIMHPLFKVPGCGSFAFLMGIFSGYPVGAKITKELYADNSISKTEAERLLAFTNNSGPLFIIGSVAAGMFNTPELGVYLLTCHILACVTVGLLFSRFYNKGNTIPKGNKNLFKRFKNELGKVFKNLESNKSEMFGSAVENSVKIILNIGGFIILFSVVINLLISTGVVALIASCIHAFLYQFNVNISSTIIEAVTSGIFEITTGVNMVSQAANIPLTLKLPVISLIIGWAGLSVHFQVLSIINKKEPNQSPRPAISTIPYFLGKFLQSIFAAFYTFIAIKIADPLFLKAESAFSTLSTTKTLLWHNYLLSSCQNLLMVLGFLIVSFIISATIGILRINILRRPSR